MLQVELKLIFVADDDSQLVEATLLLVELHAERCEVRVAVVPIGIELFLEDFASLDVEWAPSSIKMLEDLDWCGVSVGSVDVLELCVVLLVKCIAHVHCDSA